MKEESDDYGGWSLRTVNLDSKTRWSLIVVSGEANFFVFLWPAESFFISANLFSRSDSFLLLCGTAIESSSLADNDFFLF